MQFAVIKTGGKQYKVAEGDQILIEKLLPAVGESITFDEVLMTGSDTGATIGQPLVNGAKVEAKVVEQGRGKKKIVFKYKSKTRQRKKKGHRQPFTKIEILKIIAQ